MTPVPRQFNGRVSDPCVKPWGCDLTTRVPHVPKQTTDVDA